MFNTLENIKDDALEGEKSVDELPKSCMTKNAFLPTPLTLTTLWGSVVQQLWFAIHAKMK